MIKPKHAIKIVVVLIASVFSLVGIIISKQCSRKENYEVSRPNNQEDMTQKNNTGDNIIIRGDVHINIQPESSQQKQNSEKRPNEEPKNANEAYDLALYYFNNRGVKEENLDKVIEFYTMAIDLKKNFVQAYIDRGYAYTFQKKWFEATADFYHVLMNYSDYRITKDQNVGDKYLDAESMWRDSETFSQDILNGFVNGVISNNGTNLRLRQEPIIIDGNIIGRLQPGDYLTILGRGERERINGMYDYWFKVKTSSNQIGWCYGFWINFIPTIQ